MDSKTPPSMAAPTSPSLQATTRQWHAKRTTRDHIVPVQCAYVGELSALFSDWRLDFTQLKPGLLQAHGFRTCLGPVLVSMVSFNSSLLCRIEPRREFISILVPGMRSHGLSMAGQDFASGQCVVIDDNADAEIVSRGRLDGAVIAVSRTAWTEMWNSSLTAVNSEVLLKDPGMRRTEILTNCIAWIFDALRTYPEAAQSTDLQGCMSDLVLRSLGGMLGEFSPAPDGSRREYSNRRIAVERARRFIHENLPNPIRLSELCAHAHTQARSLEYGFHEVLGISPVSYIKALRLNRIHHLLLSRLSADRTITEIALDCGFWHLSQFAADYRKFFGESPSSARRRSYEQ